MRRFTIPTLLAVVLLSVVWAIPAMADLYTVTDIADLQAAIDGAGGPRTIEIVAGTHTLTVNIDVNKPDITIQGQGTLATTIQVSGTGYRFTVTGAGCTIRNLDLLKTDKTGEQNIIWINADNATIQDNRIHGQFVIGEGEVARAMVVSAGHSNLLITGNEIFALRQPAYISGSPTPSPAGTVSSNFVYGTKGWVIEGGDLVFSGNTWGTGANANVYDVAILGTCQPGFYPDIVAMSNANNAAVIEDQRPAPRILSIVAVDAAAAPGGAGSPLEPYQAIGPALARVAPGGTIRVAAGTYDGPGGINAGMTLLGPNAAICAHDAARATEAIINTGSPAIRVGTTAPVTIKGFKFDGCGLAVDSYTTDANVTLQNDIFVNTTAQTFFFANSDLLTYDCNYVSANKPGEECLFIAGDSDGSTGTRATISNSVWENTASTGMNLSSVNATITGNRFTNVAYYAALLANNSGGTTVSDNTFDNIVNPNPPGSGSWGAGVRFYTPSITTPVSVTGNRFLNSYAGVTVRAGSDITGQPISVTGNDFVGNQYGIRNQGTGTLAATCNWYGNILGPNDVPANPSPGDKVEGPVSYTPWLDGAIPGGVCNQYGLNNVAAQSPATCITPAYPCVVVPVVFTRADPTPVRGFSVTLTLSPNLSLCGAGIVPGTYLAGTPQFQILPLGGGVYTVDGASLGLPCGATGTGTLFTLNLASTVPSGTGTVTINSVTARDCANAPVTAVPGAPLAITIDNTAPAALTGLSAVQVKHGNPAGGIATGITVSWAAVEAGATVKLYRQGFGSYPEYDDAGGAVPVYPGGTWTLAASVSDGSTSLVDSPGTRDFWYYVALVEDACGNSSGVSAMTSGTLDYHLGDVAPLVPGGNNAVDGLDIAELGLHYGAAVLPAFNYLDVGPTTNRSVNALPTTDNKVNFEDLMMFAINFGQVSGPQDGALALSGANRLWLDGPAKVAAGATFTVAVQAAGAGDLQGLSLQLGWDRSVAEPVGVEAGGLAEAQNVAVLSSGAGNVDCALLGANRGLAGEGVLATVTFRALANGDPRVTLAKVDARDASNQPVTLAGVKPQAPGATSFAPAMPNPFQRSTTLSYALAKGGAVELAVYGVDGRKVATLASGVQAAGTYRLSWDGAGARPGLYYARLTTPEGRFTRTLVLMK